MNSTHKVISQGHVHEDGWMNPWSNFPLMTPARAKIAQHLPGKPPWVIYERQCWVILL